MNKKNYDPLKPRPNSEIEEILLLIKKNCDELLHETDFIRRRGQARILMAHLQELEQQPEFLLDVASGLINDSSYWIKEENFTEDCPEFLSENPFNAPEHTENIFFFFSNNKLSSLYSSPPLDPYYYRCSDYGLIVYTLEKVYSTQNQTLVHINNEEVIKHCLKEIKSSTKQTFPKEDNKYYIIADPQGVSYGLSLTVTITNSKKLAIFIAENLTEYLDIRFLIAKQIYVFDGH